MEHAVGYIVIALSVLLSGGLVGFGYWQWRKAHPRVWHRGVGVRYRFGPSTVVPWEGLTASIDVLWEIARREFPDDAPELMKFWIDVVPFDGRVTGKLAPSGRLNGTVDWQSFLWWKRYTLVVRQLEGRAAFDSALFHEAVEHYWPFRLYGDWNVDADRKGGPITERGKRLLALKREARQRARERAA